MSEKRPVRRSVAGVTTCWEEHRCGITLSNNSSIFPASPAEVTARFLEATHGTIEEVAA